MTDLIRASFGQPVLMRKAYGEALVEVGKEQERLVVLSADVSNSDYSFMFEQAFPERFFNVGIAEPAMVDTAVGLANGGFIPIANTFSFLFATRALEMVRTHLCYGKSNVKLAAAYSGLSDSFDGPTHHSITDLAILRCLPHMTVVVPADPSAVKRLLPQVVAWDGPVFFRLCRNEVPQIYTDAYQPEIGRGVTLLDGNDVTIVASGILVSRSIEAASQLREEGLSVRVVEIHTIKPLDEELLTRCARETGSVVTVEEHSIVGGLGSAVAEALTTSWPVPIERVGLADTFAETGPYDALLDKYGMSVKSIAEAARRAMKRKRLTTTRETLLGEPRNA
jgi:transketolase